MNTLIRCDWARDEPLRSYHDHEWGKPVRDERKLFEMLLLEGAQAGLSWRTILLRREGYRAAFAGFDPVAMAKLGAQDEERLMKDARIIRNRLKVTAFIENARTLVRLHEQGRSLEGLVWGVVGREVLVNHPIGLVDIPAQTPQSEAMSKCLKAEGFRFVGPTICYAFMQAVGIVDDHLTGCFRKGPPG